MLKRMTNDPPRALFWLIFLGIFLFGLNNPSLAAQHKKNTAPPPSPLQSLQQNEIAKQLGWVESSDNRCGGNYIEAAFVSPEYLKEQNKVEITSNQYTIVQQGISTLEGKVKITYGSRQITANKAYLYRDPKTGKLTAIDLSEALRLREPNTLVVAEKGRVDLKTKENSLQDILYRTAIYSNLTHTQALAHPTIRTAPFQSLSELQQPRQVQQLSAWGNAKNYSQTEPKIYNFDNVSYTTCPPTHSIWQLKASHIQLNKETGRGTARDARLLIKNIPVFYTPYMNFPIDSRRKTGFLWPTFGTINRSDSLFGHYLGLPFYWNIAPHYDTTITPTYYELRGLQVADTFRYLTPLSKGHLQIEVLPKDRYFSTFKEKEEQINQSSANTYTQAELERLIDSSNTRSAFSVQHTTRFNDHWTGNIDYNYVSDDYYLEDFSKNLTDNAQNQLPQQGEINYAGEHWMFTGRVQSYQTLHPIDVDSVFKNQYTRFPQLLLGGDYPNQWGGMHYFIANEATHFAFKNTPGNADKFPLGDRINAQPGLALPLNWPFFYINPRAQIALTEYELGNVNNDIPKHQDRGIPIFDVASGLYFDRQVDVFSQSYQQSLEPQIYYVYVPFRDQTKIPIFDTTVNTLTYDQLFVYNRFSSIDRINDANHVSIGITTRFIDQDSGIERLRAGIGEIVYFKNRAVTLCLTSDVCTDYPDNNDNKRRLSPLSGTLNFNMAQYWTATADAIWNPQTKELDNQTIGIHYKLDQDRVVNLGYSFVRNGDPFGGIIDNSNAGIAGKGNQNNLQLTDLSFSWPILPDWGVVGRWSEDWETLHFQNLFYGLQYDSCCWAARFVAGKTFTGVSDNRPQYNSQFYFQITLKGLGTFNPKGDPTAALRNNIAGYESRFGQDI